MPVSARHSRTFALHSEKTLWKSSSGAECGRTIFRGPRGLTSGSSYVVVFRWRAAMFVWE